MAKLTATLVSAVLGLSACQMDDHRDLDVASSSQDAITINAITINAITINAITINAITINAITINSITSHDLSTTTEGRQVLSYLVRCALDAEDTLTMEQEGQTYQFNGVLGLAPEWTERGLSEGERARVSSCLLAHVNATGTPVVISARAIGHIVADPQEMTHYPVYEGTFFGNVFGEDTAYYACTGDDYDVAMANAPDRVLRVCTDDDANCQMQTLGRCRDVCDTRVAGHGWTDCHADGHIFTETVSMYLASPNDDGNNQTCGEGQSCDLVLENVQDGILDCSDAGDCRAECREGSICAMDGTSATVFEAVVESDSIADVNCHENDDCRVKVQELSSVEIDCKDSGKCSEIRCTDGSDCLLDCTGADDCGFAVCEGQLDYCGGDVYVCNRACPDASADVD